MMRIAICLSGLVRTYKLTYQNFVDSIITPNQSDQFDTFISTSFIEHSNNSMERTRRLAWNGPDTPPFPETLIDFNDIVNKYKPTSFQCEVDQVFNAPWYVDTPGVNIQSLMAMIYRIRACDLLRRQHELLHGFTYDLVIRSRFDTLMPFPLVLRDHDRSAIVTPSMMQPKIFPDREWVNDKFAIGTSEQMSQYCDWFINLENLSRTVPIQPEVLLSAHLAQYNIAVRPFGCEMELVRLTGY